MRLEERAVSDALGTILLHNVAGPEGGRALKKGTRLEAEHLARLAEIGRQTVEVAVLDVDDVQEDAAALLLAEALQTPEIEPTRPTAGRINLRSTVNGLLEVDEERLLSLNLLPGLALATRRQYTVVGPDQETASVASLKVVPFALPRADLDQALALAEARPGIVEVRPFTPGRRAALLFVAEPGAHERVRQDYLAPTRTRLEKLAAELVATEDVVDEKEAIAEAAQRLARDSDLLLTASQTSIVHEDDTILRALRAAGAEMTLSGAPVEPGNMLALAYFAHTPVMCLPGCARGLRRNVVDLVLPRLLLGQRLDRRKIAALGLGGFLTAAERAGDVA